VTGLTSGKGKVYKKPAAITDATVKDVRCVGAGASSIRSNIVLRSSRSHLQLLLFSAERALAHSHELKSLRTKPNAPGSTRKEQISWLRSALKSSTSLHSLVSKLAGEGTLNQRTLAEITIYHLSVRAELAFERSLWAEALTDLSARRKLLSTLADAARDSFDQALALEFMDAYDPLIRFGAYKLGRAESHDIEGVVSDVDDEMLEEAVPGFAKLVEGLRGETGVEEMEKGRKELEDVQFAGDKVEMRSAEIVGVMLRVQEVLGKMGKSKGMRGWDRVLGVLGEAEAVARRLLEDHQVSRVERGSSAGLVELETDKEIRHRARPPRFDPTPRPNPSPSRTSTSSTCSSRTASAATCFSSTRCPPRRSHSPPTSRSSRSPEAKSASRRPSSPLRLSSSFTTRSCRASVRCAVSPSWRKRMV
jgi:signal recognition particle subunit SRP68